MTTLGEAAELALQALERANKISGHANNKAAITALRQALEAEQQHRVEHQQKPSSDNDLSNENPGSATTVQQEATDRVINAARGLLTWIEIKHRPPVRDQLETGRMVSVRLHALADLHDAIVALGGAA